MLVLGIDTATVYSSLSLVRDANLLAELNWQCRRNHSVELLPNLNRLLEITGLQPPDIQAIGVAIGPGSFTGLRAGLSVAKGLALSLECPLAGVSSFETVALANAVPGLQIAPVISTRQGRFAAAVFKPVDGRLVRTGPDIPDLPGDIVSRIKTPTLFCGDIEGELEQNLRQVLGDRAVFPVCNSAVRRSDMVARLAAEKITGGQNDTIAGLEPYYLHAPKITRPNPVKKKPLVTNLQAGIIWDMDGVIVDSAPFHLQAWQETTRPLGIDFSREYFWHTFGIKNESIVEGLGAGFGPEQARQLVEAKEARFRALISRNLEPLPGARDLILELKKRKIAMAVASSAPRQNVNYILQCLKIRRFFRVVVGEEDVVRGKPDPEVFLKAAALIGLPPGCCLVIEDSQPGITAAKKAGMSCLAVSGTGPGSDTVGQDLTVENLSHVTADELLDLINRA